MKDGTRTPLRIVSFPAQPVGARAPERLTAAEGAAVADLLSLMREWPAGGDFVRQMIAELHRREGK